MALSHRVPLHFDSYSGKNLPVILEVEIESRRPQPVHWAIVLDADAALLYEPQDPAGDARPDDGERYDDRGRVTGTLSTAWFVRNAGVGHPGERVNRAPNMGGSAFVGESPSGQVKLSVVGPGSGPLLIDNGPPCARAGRYSACRSRSPAMPRRSSVTTISNPWPQLLARPGRKPWIRPFARPPSHPPGTARRPTR